MMQSLRRFGILLTVACWLHVPTPAQDVAAAKMTKAKTIDPSGTWRWESANDRGEPVRHQLKLSTNERNEVTAIYAGRLDGLKSKKGRIEGNRLFLDFDVEVAGYRFSVAYVATITGDKASGTVSLSSNRGSTEFPWAATRTAQLSDVVGRWELALGSEEGEGDNELIVTEKDGEYSAIFAGGEINGVVKDLKTKGSLFYFTVTGQQEGIDFEARFISRPMGNKLMGEVIFDMPPNHHWEMSLSGKRLVPGAKPTAKRKIELSDVVGTWSLSLETEDEELHPRLIVKEDDGKYTAVFHGDEGGVFPVKDLRTRGNLFFFTVTGKLDGKDFVAKFGARIRGTKLRGEMNLKIGGETVEMALSGRLAQNSGADRSRGAE